MPPPSQPPLAGGSSSSPPGSSSSSVPSTSRWPAKWIDGKKNKKGEVTQVLLDPNGFRMTLNKVEFSRKFFVCKEKKTLGCSVRCSLDISSGMIVHLVGEHNHDNKLAESKIEKIVKASVTQAATDPHMNPRSVHQKIVTDVLKSKELGSSCLSLLPSKLAVSRQVLKSRKKSLNIPPPPKDFLFEIPHEFTITEDGLQFMICNVEVPGRDGRVIGFASPNGLGLLGHSEEVFGDGTFELMKYTIFYQLWVACVKVEGVVLPCAFFFLPSKEYQVYKIMFQQLKMANPDISPSTWNLDFEWATMKAAMEIFPDSRIQGCIVHFKRCLRRKLQELGLSDCANKNLDMMVWLRKIWSVGLVPPTEVLKVWEIIKENAPYEDEAEDEDEAVGDGDNDDSLVVGYDEALHNFINYFEGTFIGLLLPNRSGNRKKPRFNHEIWSVREAVICDQEFSTNASESWNSVSKLTVTAKPNFWQLVNTLKGEEGVTRAKVMSLRAATYKDPNPSRTRKRNERRDALKELVENYSMMPTGEFLDACIAFYNDF